MTELNEYIISLSFTGGGFGKRLINITLSFFSFQNSNQFSKLFCIYILYECYQKKSVKMKIS